jgi:hypothetical protein
MVPIREIVQVNQVSLTTDAWTSITRDGYVTCMVHFIEPKSWTLHCFSLGIFKKNSTSTAIDVVRYTDNVLETFGVLYTQLTCVVTDTESTTVAAGHIYKEKSYKAGSTTAWHGCIDHMLELITKLAFKDLPHSISFMQDIGIPCELHSDDAKELKEWKMGELLKKIWIKGMQSEPYSPWQVRAELCIWELERQMHPRAYGIIALYTILSCTT